LTIDELLCWAIALIVGFLARLAFGHRVPFGIFGTCIVALAGVWFATDVVLINLPMEHFIYEVPLLKSFASAVLFEIIWYLVVYRSYRVWSRRRQIASAHR
jgi:uncharacterized membrane protein YeaQ/YmgE (transglycosylase-associated protein family)